MPAILPCPLHGAHTWMAYCSDCTTWHLTRSIAQRDAAVAAGRSAVPALASPASTAPAHAAA